MDYTYIGNIDYAFCYGICDPGATIIMYFGKKRKSHNIFFMHHFELLVMLTFKQLVLQFITSLLIKEFKFRQNILYT